MPARGESCPAKAEGAPATYLLRRFEGKGGQELLALSLAEELSGTGVTANVILVRSIGARDETNDYRTTPEEIASTIAYLCSDEARMISGARIPAHGRP